MEICSLHPIEPEVARRYVAALTGGATGEELAPAAPAWGERLLAQARRGYERALAGSESGADAVSFGLGQVLATVEPSFVLPSAGLTIWEARLDRGVGMLLRPPSRLFDRLGLDERVARMMPIRLDLSRGTMGGAFVPDRLVPDLLRFMESKTDRELRRLAQAELDGVAVLGTMIEACRYAAARGLGLYEVMDAITAEAPEANPPGARIVVADRKALDPALRRQLEEAAKRAKPPGFFARLLGRRGHAPFPGDG